MAEMHTTIDLIITAVVCLMIGGWIGVFVTALCAMAGKSDRHDRNV